MIKKLLLLTLTILLLHSCKKETTTTSMNVTELYGIDFSLSSDEMKLPDTVFFRQVIKRRINKDFDFTISVGKIGNPNDYDRAFPFASFEKIPEVDYNTPPSERKKTRKLISSIKESNNTKLLQFLEDYQKYVAPNLGKKDERTDISGFIKKAEIFLSEPTFSGNNWQKRLIIISDGLQDIDETQEIEKISVHNLGKVSNLELNLVGFKSVNDFQRIPHDEFISINDLQQHLTK